MRILVFGHRLEMGGSQTNTVDLAAEIRDRFGHEVTLFATPGRSAELARAHDLALIEAPEPGRVHPSPRMTRALDDAVRRVRPDLLHVWEWQQILDAYYSAAHRSGLPMLGTNMMMEPLRSIPPEVPLTASTQQIVDGSRAIMSAPVWRLEPPVDTDRDDPGIVDPMPFIRAHDLADDSAARFVIVSRIVESMKLESMRDAIRAVELLAPARAVRLVIVGGGTAEASVASQAEGVNARLGRRAIVMTGPLQDPRPAYAAAEVMLGMGSSAIRGLAFGKPTIVLGEQGFSEVFDATTRPLFAEQGYYGIGPGPAGGDAAARLARQMEQVLDDPAIPTVAAESRALVVERYSVPAATVGMAGSSRTC